MDTLSMGTAVRAWWSEFCEPRALMDADLGALYAGKRAAARHRNSPSAAAIGAEPAGGRIRALRAALHRPSY